ncbi:hypothetical protein ACHQM5_008144 [Ranunculus cassubicifolius]
MNNARCFRCLSRSLVEYSLDTVFIAKYLHLHTCSGPWTSQHCELEHLDPDPQESTLNLTNQQNYMGFQCIPRSNIWTQKTGYFWRELQCWEVEMISHGR